MQNTFRAIGHRTVHRPLCHEYLAPDRTTFSGITSFYTVLWHITLKAICKKQYSSRASNTPPPGQPQVIPHILQNTFRAIGHRTAHRPLCHEYLAPDRTTFSSLSSFYTVLWHITLKAICKITEFLTCLKHATSWPTQVFLSKSPCPVNPHPHRTKLISLPVLSGDSSVSTGKLILLPVLSGDTSASPDKPRPIAKPNRSSQNCQKRLEYTNAMGASYLFLLK